MRFRKLRIVVLGAELSTSGKQLQAPRLRYTKEFAMRGARLSCGLIIALCCLCCRGTESQRIKIDVPADYVGSWDSGVRIVGRTGLKLATMMTIEGNWTYLDEGKQDGLVFHIMTVNGSTLSHNADYWAACVDAVDRRGRKIDPKRGTVWKMRAFETGKYDAGTPDEYLRLTGQKVPLSTQSAVWQLPLTLNLVGIVQ